MNRVILVALAAVLLCTAYVFAHRDRDDYSGGGTCVCYGYAANDPRVCHGNGRCVSEDVCVCFPGYHGRRCHLGEHHHDDDDDDEGAAAFTCFGIAANTPGVCSGHGCCTAQDCCTCNAGYNGTQCECALPQPPAPAPPAPPAPQPSCAPTPAPSPAPAPSCQAGFGLTSNNNCVPVCFNLLATDCNVCSGHGNCVAPNTCTCNPGFEGQQCETQCQQPAPPTPPAAPSCPTGYTGDNCSIPICFSQPATDPNVCSGRGACIAPDTCNCTDNWEGDLCNTFSCYGINMMNQSVCSGRGMCVRPNECFCPLGFTGIQCECQFNVSQCPCIQPTPLPPAACNPGYVGLNCNIAVCFDILANDTTVCSGHGTCVAPDTCQCLSGFEGQKCDTQCASGINSGSTLSSFYEAFNRDD